MRNRNKIALALFTAIILIVSYLILPTLPPRSPIGIHKTTPPKQNQYYIIGFLPYWNYTKLTPLAESSVTHIAYFSLRLKGDGEIEYLTTPISEEPGYTTLKKLSKSPPTKPLILTISQADNDEINLLLSNPSYTDNAINTIVSLTREYNVSGINIDIEPSKSVSYNKRQAFADFIKNLNEKLNDDILLSVDVYPTAASKNRLWDLGQISPYVDHVVVMTYDYHQRSTSTSGPNSPLRGAPGVFDEDILKNISEISKLVEPKKILLGIPFYGYEWTTATDEKYSQTLSGSLASLERISQILKDKDTQLNWDRNSLTPYIVHIEDGSIKQIYFDNPQSIKLKLDLVEQAGLGGIAIWALGYEGNNPLLWSTIQTLNEQ